MAMPNHLIFVRHGQSEANVIQKHTRHGVDMAVVRMLFARPDWRHRLSTAGVEQAAQVGEWIRQHIADVQTFDALYTSPFLRTRETAAHIGGAHTSGWTIDSRLVERYWGIYGKMSREEQRERFPLTAAQKEDDPWNIRLDGGESLADVHDRFRDFQATLHREQAGKNVFVVTHGDFMNVARSEIERLLPEEWEALDSDKRYKVKNCTILHYTRVNPEDETDVRSKIRWRRYIYPDVPESSPDGGAWVELSERRRYTGDELLGQIEQSPRLIETT